MSASLVGVIFVAHPASGFSLGSTAFAPDGDLPTKYTCDGSDTAQSRHTGDTDAAVSPPLAWQDPPAGARAFALIVDDIDAPRGSWVQWIVYDIPGTAQSLPEGVARTPALPDGSKQGRNDFRNLYYQGPCPPKGDTPHRYSFTLYALDAPTGLEIGGRGITKPQLLQAMQGHTLGTAELIGRCHR